jgi:hypothetical protein
MNKALAAGWIKLLSFRLRSLLECQFQVTPAEFDHSYFEHVHEASGVFLWLGQESTQFQDLDSFLVLQNI